MQMNFKFYNFIINLKTKQMDIARNTNMRAIKYWNRPLKVKRWLKKYNIERIEDVTTAQSFELLVHVMPKVKKSKKVVSTYVPYTSNQELWARN